MAGWMNRFDGWLDEPSHAIHGMFSGEPGRFHLWAGPRLSRATSIQLLQSPAPALPPCRRFASCGGDRQVFLWDVSTGNIIRKFRGHDAYINTVRKEGCCYNVLCCHQCSHLLPHASLHAITHLSQPSLLALPGSIAALPQPQQRRAGERRL